MKMQLSLRNRVVAVVAAVLMFVLVGGAAWAFWTAVTTPGSGGAAAATSVNAGSTPSANASGSTVTVTWTASTLATGQAVAGYRVARYNATTLVAQTVLSNCAGVIAATSCTENNVPGGSWKYAVTPLFATNWEGAESAKSATVTINVAPVGVADSYSVAEGGTLTESSPGVLGNDVDIDPMTAILVSGVANGTLSLASNGGFVYTPTAGFVGSDSFTYKANDGVFDSARTTVTLTVTAVNSAPVNSVPGAQQTPKNTSRVFSSGNSNLISISDVDAGGATVQVQLTATNGTITLPVITGLTFSVGDGTSDATMTFTGTVANLNLRLDGLTFIPTTNFPTGASPGAASVQIITNDLGNTGSGGAQSDSDTIAIAVNALGIFDANTDIGAAAAGTSSSYTSGSYTVKGSGWDVWDIDDGVQYLYRQLTGDGRLTARVVSETITPTTNNAAKAGVMFRQSLANNSRQAMMNIKKANGSEFVYRSATGGTSAASTTVGPAPAYWVRMTRVGDVFTAERSVDGVNWVQQGTPQTIAMGTTAYVGLAVSAVDVSKLNTAVFDNVALTTPPTAVADSYTTNEDTTLNIAAAGVLSNDTDPENNALTAVLVSGTSGLTLNANGSFTYVPPSNFSGTASFTYRANDSVFNSNTVTVTLTVNPANEVPSFTKGANQTGLNTGAQSVPGWATAISQGTGESGQLVTFLVTNDNNGLFSVQPQVSATGTLTYTPNSSTTGVATVSVRIMDNGGTANGGTDTSAIQTFTITTGTDVTGPTGGSVDAAGLVGTGTRYSTSTTLSIAFTPGTDPSGIAGSGATLTRATATLTSSGGTANGVCGTFGGYSLISGGNDPVSPKSDTVSDQACYRYRYTVSDTLGNPTTYTSGDIKVDTTAPTAPPLAFSAFTNTYWTGSGTTLYYRPAAASGSFTVTGTSTDAASGVVSYSYPALGTNWSSTPGSLGVRVYSWSGAPAAPGTVNVTATSNAGTASANSPFTLTADTTAPTAGTVTYADGSTGAGLTVSVSFSTGTDGGSGIGTRLLQRSSAPLTGLTCGTYGAFTTVSGGTNPTSPLVDTVTSGTCNKYQYVVADNVGNTHTASNANVARTPYGAYWAFNAGSGTTAVDSFGNNNTGTLQATAGWTAGKVGANALNLTGASTSWVDVAGPVIDSSETYTVAGWIKLNTLTGVQTIASIDGTNISPFYLQFNGGVFNFQQRGSDSTTSTLAFVNGPAPVVGTWYHLAGVYNKTANTIELFVNGVSQGSATATTAWKANGHTVIGKAKWNAVAADFVNGAIDEVRFYDVALTRAQIADLYGTYADMITGTTGLLSHWRLGEATPVSAMDDISPTNNNGTYVNAPTTGVAGAIAGDANTAVQFDGVSDYATAARQISTNFSMEFWFKSTQTYSGPDFGQPHCSQWWQGAGMVDADTGGAANDFGVALCDGKVVAGTGTPELSVASSGTYNNGAWHHVVFTRTQSTGAMILYVDGVSVGTTSGTTAALTSTVNINLGRRADGQQYFAGTLDEVAVYTTVLSPATIAAHYNSGL
jgi:hypothetical protein